MQVPNIVRLLGAEDILLMCLWRDVQVPIIVRSLGAEDILLMCLWHDVQVPNIVRSLGAEDILLMRHQTQFLWNTYFSSIEKIVATTLEVI